MTISRSACPPPPPAALLSHLDRTAAAIGQPELATEGSRNEVASTRAPFGRALRVGSLSCWQVLCDCEFSLAYGNRVLLHNTRLKLKRGKCYGLIGPNGAGKSTLMRSIAADLVEGFPKEIRSVYVECDVSATHAEMSCVDFVHGVRDVMREE